MVKWLPVRFHRMRPLLDAYRRYFGWRMALFMAGLLFGTMAVSAAAMGLAFSALGLVLGRYADVRARLTTFSLDYTSWLDLLFGAFALHLFWVDRRRHLLDI